MNRLSGAPSTGAGETHSTGTMQGLSTNDQMEWKFRKDKQVAITYKCYDRSRAHYTISYFVKECRCGNVRHVSNFNITSVKYII